MTRYMTVNHRQVSGVTVCDVVEIAPNWVDPRPVKGMQGVDAVTAKQFVQQKNEWNKEWLESGGW